MFRPQLLQELRPLHYPTLMDWRNFQFLVKDGSLVARVVLRIDPTGGTHHLQSPFWTMAGEFCHHLLPNIAPTTIRIRVSNLKIELRESTLGERSNNYTSKGKGNKYFTQPSGKRGRDSRDDNARDVRQKSWNQDGKSIAEAWSKSPHIRLYVRTLSLGAVKTLLIPLRSADFNFQKNSKDIPFEKWHENSDTDLAHLHKALGMPVRFTVSPHFYYRAAQ
jgi:hypothetical protein